MYEEVEDQTSGVVYIFQYQGKTVGNADVDVCPV